MKITEVSLPTNKNFLSENVIYRDFHRVGQMLVERRLSDADIENLFKAVEKGYSDSGKNRTMIGKGKDAVTDVATAINQAYQGVADKISKSGPVSAFDTQVDKLTDTLKSTVGGDNGAVMQAVTKYRKFAKEHPVMQGAIYAGLIALVGLSGAGLGGAAILGGMKAFDKMLLGNKASSALWSGFLTGATAYGISQATQAFQGAQAAPGAPTAIPADTGEIPGVTTFSGDIPTYNIQAGDTLSQIAQQQNVSIQDLMQANPQITDPSKLFTGQTLEIPAPTGNAVYQGGVGLGGPTPPTADAGIRFPPGSFPGGDTGMTPAEIAQQQATNAVPNAVPNVASSNPNNFVFDPNSGEMIPADSALAQELNQTPASTNPMANKTRMPRESRDLQRVFSNVKKMPITEMIDRKATLWHWQLQESVSGTHKRSVQLSQKGVQHLFLATETYQKNIINFLTELDTDGPKGQKISQKLAGKQATVQPTTPAAAAQSTTPATTAQPTTPTTPATPATPAAGAPAAQPSKPGIMSRVKQGLGNFGRQLTTAVTAEKLNTNWKRAGLPPDSDKLFAFLQQQGVPAEVATDVYKQLGIPSTAAAQPQQATQSTGGQAATAQPQQATQSAGGQAATAQPQQATQSAGGQAAASQGGFFSGLKAGLTGQEANVKSSNNSQSGNTAQAGAGVAQAGAGVQQSSGMDQENSQLAANSFSSPDALLSSFKSYVDAGGKISPRLRGAVKDIWMQMGGIKAESKVR